MKRSIDLGSTSLPQLQANYLVATWISAVAIISVTFGLWILHKSKLDSTYIYVWSVASIILSGTTLFSKSSQEPNLSSINWDESNLRRLDKCGHHPPPLIYCANTSYMSFESDYITPAVIAACFMICGMLGLQKVTHCLPSELGFFATFPRLLNAIESVIPPRAVPIFIIGWKIIVELYLLGVTVFVLLVVVTELFDGFQHDPSGQNDWTFGQPLP